jgi:hypothetical protein
MNKRMLVCACCAAAFAMMGAQPAASAHWVRGYVVGYYGFAFRYAGRDDYARAGEIQPGVDCPHGSTNAWANPGTMRHMLSLISWRSDKEVEALVDTFKDEGQQEGGGAGGAIALRRYAASYRGYKPGIQTFVNPFAADDPGEPEVQSRIGEGFNLDGKIKPTDFVSPDGEKGIDNNLYRAWGCDNPWRGPGNATLDLRANDKMQDGLFTIVVRVSGNKDPMNDDDATLEVGSSPDHIVKDGQSKTGTDYSYRILKSAEYTKLKARVVDGVVETEQADIHMPEMAWFPNQNRDSDFRQGKIRIVTRPDGTVEGLVGGYRDWRDLYAQNTFGQGGATQGAREHEDPISLYYALRRNADGMFNPKTGRYDGISTAYRLKLAEAYVVDPPAPMAANASARDLQGNRIYNGSRDAFIKGAETLVPQPPMPGSEEAASRPYMDRLVGTLTNAADMVARYRQLYINIGDDPAAQKKARDALVAAQRGPGGRRGGQQADADGQ